jgi:hypothetical protein
MMRGSEVLMSEASCRCFEPLPRERWAEHPHFPSQVLLLGSHQNFRRISKTLVAAVGVERDVEAGRGPLEVRQAAFDQWQRSMRSHEHYEEHKLYPFLRHRFGVSTALLERGHEALHEIERALRSAANDGEAARWAATMARFDVVLHEHLRDEEDLVIPCLLALEPREFTRYYHSSIGELLATPSCGAALQA